MDSPTSLTLIYDYMASYNLTRYVEELLEANESSPPSFTVHLYPEYWTLNSGSKFLYNNPVAVRILTHPSQSSTQSVVL